MSVSSAASGTKTATGGGTEDTLTTQTTGGIYVLVVDMSNLAAGDEVTLKIKTKYASGGTSRLAYQETFVDAQNEPNKYSIPVPIDTEIVCTLTQEMGTARDFYWNLLIM